MRKFFRIFIIAIFIISAVVLIFVGVEDNKVYKSKKAVQEHLESNRSLYPVYERLDDDEKAAYVQLCAELENFSNVTSSLFTTNSYDEMREIESRLGGLYRDILYEQSEIFWVDPYNFDYLITEKGGIYTISITPEYLLEKEEALEKQEIFNKKIDSIVTQAKSKNGTYDKVLFVHDYILSNAEYDFDVIEKDNFSTTGINAYGCLVDGKTICSGYTMAFDAIMKRLGYECAAEFNSYSELSLTDGHVWNYCNLDGEYYYFDLTWDEINDDSAVSNYIDYYHCYFAITTEELEAARKILDTNSPAPICNGTKYNYFVHNNMSFATYDYNAVKSALLMQSGKEFAAVRFDSYSELLRARTDLIDNGKVFEIFTDIDKIEHMTSESGLQLYFFFP